MGRGSGGGGRGGGGSGGGGRSSNQRLRAGVSSLQVGQSFTFNTTTRTGRTPQVVITRNTSGFRADFVQTSQGADNFGRVYASLSGLSRRQLTTRNLGID